MVKDTLTLYEEGKSSSQLDAQTKENEREGERDLPKMIPTLLCS